MYGGVVEAIYNLIRTCICYRNIHEKTKHCRALLKPPLIDSQYQQVIVWFNFPKLQSCLVFAGVFELLESSSSCS